MRPVQPILKIQSCSQSFYLIHHSTRPNKLEPHCCQDEAPNQPQLADIQSPGSITGQVEMVDLAHESNPSTPASITGSPNPPSIPPWYKVHKHPKTAFSTITVILSVIIAAVALNPAYRSVVLTNAGNKIAALGNRIANNEYDLTVYDWCEAHPVR